MKRMMVAVVVLGLSVTAIGKSKPVALSVWVHTVFANGEAAVGDSYVTREQAVQAAQQIESDEVWVTVSQSALRLPKLRKGVPGWWDKLHDLSALMAPTLHAQSIQELAPNSALILPTVIREGEFVSPSVDPGASRRARAAIGMSALDLVSPLNAVMVTLEKTADGGKTWQFVCGAGLLGAAPISSETGQPVAPFSVCTTTPGQEIRSRVFTCFGTLPNPSCAPIPQAVGVTVDLLSQ